MAQQRFCGSCGIPLPVVSAPPVDLPAGNEQWAPTEPLPTAGGPVPPASSPGWSTLPPAGELPPTAGFPPGGPPPTSSTPPPTAPEWTAPSLKLPVLNIDRLLMGDWGGAALAAVAGYATAFALGLVLTLLAGGERLPVRAILAIVGALVGAAFGGDITGTITSGLGGGSGSIGAYPLTITVLSLAVLGIVFWRRIRLTRPSLGDAMVQAVRTALLFAALLALSSLVLRYRGTLPGDQTSSSVHATILGSATGGFLLASMVCLGWCLRAAEWLPPQLRSVRDTVAGPVAGLGFLLGAACLLTLIGGAVVILVSEHTALRAEFAGLLGGVPNLAVWGLLIGTGTGLVGRGNASGFLFGQSGAGTSSAVHITDIAEQRAWWWLVTVGAIVCLVLGALVVVYLSRSVERSRRTLLVFAGLYVLAAPVLAHLASVYLHGNVAVAEGGSSGSGEVSVGPSLAGALGVAIPVGIVAAILALALAPKLFSRPPAAAVAYQAAPGFAPQPYYPPAPPPATQQRPPAMGEDMP